MFWNQPGWSLSCEAFFYLVFPYFAPLVAKSKSPLRLAAWAWLLSLIVPALYANGVLNRSYLDFALYNPLVRLPEFFIGVCLGVAYQLKPKAIRGLSATSAIALFLAISASPYLPKFALHNSLLDPVFAALIWGLGTEQVSLSRFLEHPLLITLGEASYSIYIFQSPVWIWLKAASIVILKFTPHNSAWFFSAYVVTLIIFSYAVYRWFETPMRRYLRGAKKPAPAAAVQPQ
jgi:peptidoglycan/LPS O-acetylase OafA/YrhL